MTCERDPELASRLVCLTDGHASEAIDHPTQRAASVRFVVKPFLPDHLLDVVRHTLARDAPP
jgi:hypothetical protein